MPRKQHPCIVCGTPTFGERCRKCHARKVTFMALEETRESDAEILGYIDANLPKARVGEILGISRQAVQERVAKAKERQRLRDAADAGVEVEDVVLSRIG